MVNTLAKYNLYDLGYINKELKETYKNLNNHIKIWKDEGLFENEVYRRGYFKSLHEEIKILKKIKKELLKERAKLKAKLLGKNTCYHDDMGSSGINYWVFHKGCTNDDIIAYLERIGVDTEGVQWNSIYDCTGKYFSYGVDIYEKEKTIVASQWWGYDV